ncbi:ABC transporter ATP-binding protein [Marinoscillum sp. MHG1-6]|uniref:ABC transporter ATP-binding protein n=1 Tax=Marinoscillum sp. MHG1-6 TaxID=2959627 RepID=UPI002158701B|nr:ABC transporter ATP-binding protein [Marinoscillum sp. MHG1-6]
MDNPIFQIIGRILKILPPNFKKQAAGLFLGIVTSSLLEIVGLASILPLLAAILKDGFIHQNSITHSVFTALDFENDNMFILFLSGAILLFIAIKNLFAIWVQKWQAMFCWDLHEKLSSKVFRAAYEKGFLYFTGNNSNKVLNRINTVPQQFAQQMLVSVFLFLNEIIILILIISSLLIYDAWALLLLVGIVLPVFLLFYRINRNKINLYGRYLNELGPQISKPVYELVFGYVDVAINGVFGNFKKRFLSNIRKASHYRVGMLVLLNIPNRLVEVCVIIAILIMLLYGLFALKDPEKILALMSVFGLAAYRSIPSINRLMQSVMNIKNFEFSLELLEEYVPASKESQIIAVKEISFDEKIELKEIAYQYPNAKTPIIKDFSLVIRKGEAVGIMGKSGSGKTTLMNVMLGFLSLRHGKLLVDDVDISKETLSSWQMKCGYVRQDVFLIDGSLRDNIAFGIEPDQIDEMKLMEVLRKSQLLDMLDSLPEGLDTNIGERGARISGGQRQRVGIARALYHGAEVLFFDEATSALDTKTEEEITESIRSLHDNNITMVIIAHRESTLKYCDRVIAI